MLKRSMVLCAAAVVLGGSGVAAQNQAVIAAQPVGSPGTELEFAL